MTVLLGSVFSTEVSSDDCAVSIEACFAADSRNQRCLHAAKLSRGL